MLPDEMSSANEASQSTVGDNAATSLGDQTLLVVARLMEGGEEDEDTCKTLDRLTTLLSDEKSGQLPGQDSSSPLHEFIDLDGFETILGYLDMRQGDMVRGHATLTVSAYLKASGQKGTEYLSEFFKDRVSKGTYDDFIVAFSVAASIFPIVPDISASLFLSDGFVNSLGSLMKRKWKSKKVEQACLEMLNAACMSSACRDAIQKHCLEWLEEIITEAPTRPAEVNSPERHITVEDGPLQQRVHSENVRNLAAVILAKLKAVPLTSKTGPEERIQSSSTSMEDLSDRFTTLLVGADKDVLTQQTSIEGLAYASLQPRVKEKLVSQPTFLKSLIRTLSSSPEKSSVVYGGLTILDNLTRYLPTLSEEQKRMTQLKAYANASSSSLEPDPLDDSEHVVKRGRAVFEAGVIPFMVTHCHNVSIASRRLIVSIMLSLAQIKNLRGNIAQQGGIKLLLHAYSTFPVSEVQARRTTAHAIACILISTHPEHVFGGTNPLSPTLAIQPLVSLLEDDPTSEQRNLLPVFESLLALTNLASTDDSVRNPMIRVVFPYIDDLLFSKNLLIVRSATELICNLVQSDQGVAKYADGNQRANQRMEILIAMADGHDVGVRRAAGGALATMTQWDAAVNAILEIGVRNILALCWDDHEDVRHRGVVIVLNLITVSSKIGDWGVKRLREAGAYEQLMKGLKKCETKDVTDAFIQALDLLRGSDI